MNTYYFDFHPRHKFSGYYVEVIAESLYIAKHAVRTYLGFPHYEYYDNADNFNPEIYKKGCYASIKQRRDKPREGFLQYGLKNKQP